MSDEKRACAIPGCERIDREGVVELSFHKFPANEGQNLLWLSRIREGSNLPNWAPTKYDRICGRHFDDSCFYNASGQRRIRKVSLPSLHLGSGACPLVEKRKQGNLTSPTTADNTTPKRPRLSRQLFSIGTSPLAGPSSTMLTPTSTRVIKEHSYSKSPEDWKTEANSLRNKLYNARMEIIHLKRKLSRRDNKLQTVKGKLAEATSLPTEKLNSLVQQFPGILGSLLRNQKQLNVSRSKKGMVYSDDVRKFAVTLHFYSPRAYLFVRQLMALPHPDTLGKWMDGSDCGPGLNERVVAKIAAGRENAANPSVVMDVALMVDEMALHKELIWDNSRHKFAGYADYGAGECEGDDAPMAGNAMVVMIAGIVGGWKAPIGYILTEKCDGLILKSFLDKAFILLEKYNFNVVSLTCDGNSANVSAFNAYGVFEDYTLKDRKSATLAFPDIVCEFPNPAAHDKKVRAIYDPVHMLKLWRNLFKETKSLKWKGQDVSFKVVESLHNLQDNEKIRAGNKLSNYHLEFEKHKMKVKYAAQILSESTADAVKFCRQELNLPQFRGSKGTEDFIYAIDRFFDICNSRHPFQRGWKAPIRRDNLVRIADFLKGFAEDVLQMTCVEVTRRKGKVTETTKYLHRSLRKRAALGSLISIKSILAISCELLYRTEHPLKYFLSYRLCQDLLELFFNKVRGRLGRNNNPNVVEFRRFMVHYWHCSWLKSTSTGNCIEFQKGEDVPGGLLPLVRSRKAKEQEEMVDVDLEIEGLASPVLSDFYRNCLAYIAGNVIRAICPKLNCDICIGALFDTLEDKLDAKASKLIQVKQYNVQTARNDVTMRGLLTPCKSVLTVIEKADAAFRQVVATRSRMDNLDLVISVSVLKSCLDLDLFPHVKTHVLDFDATQSESHLSALIKKIVRHFLKIRLYDYGKRFQKCKSVSNRHIMTKQVLFRNE